MEAQVTSRLGKSRGSELAYLIEYVCLFHTDIVPIKYHVFSGFLIAI